MPNMHAHDPRTLAPAPAARAARGRERAACGKRNYSSGGVYLYLVDLVVGSCSCVVVAIV